MSKPTTILEVLDKYAYRVQNLMGRSLFEETIQARAEIVAIVRGDYEKATSVLEKAQRDIDWMLNHKKFSNQDVFNYLTRVIAKMRERIKKL